MQKKKCECHTCKDCNIIISAAEDMTENKKEKEKEANKEEKSPGKEKKDGKKYDKYT